MSAGGKSGSGPMLACSPPIWEMPPPRVVRAAVVVELTHLATLYHDDVMDEAARAPGCPLRQRRWDNSIAILTGDLLFSRASNLLADLGPHAVRIQAHTFERLVIGQIRETVGPQPARTHRTPPRGARRQDRLAGGHLGRFGAGFAGVDARSPKRCAISVNRSALRSSSATICSTSPPTRRVGKPPGTDLREGIDTLPVLYALRGSDPDAARLRELVASPLIDDADHAEALLLLRKSDAMLQARSTMTGYAESARSLLDRLPDVPARAARRVVRSRDRTDWLTRPHVCWCEDGARGCLGAGSFHGLVISRNTRAIATMTAMVSHQTITVRRLRGRSVTDKL